MPLARASSINRGSFSSKSIPGLHSGSVCCTTCGDSDHVAAGEVQPRFCTGCGGTALVFLDDIVPSSVFDLQEDDRMSNATPVLLPEKWKPGKDNRVRLLCIQEFQANHPYKHLRVQTFLIA